MTQMLYPDWREQIRFSPQGPQREVLFDADNLRVALEGLEAGQRIALHPDGASVFYFLEGNGWITVETERLAVQAGATVVMPAGAKRGIEAETRLAFLVARAAQETPHRGTSTDDSV